MDESAAHAMPAMRSEDRHAAVTVAVLLGLAGIASYQRGSPLLTAVCAALSATLLILAFSFWLSPLVASRVRRRRAARLVAEPKAQRPRRLRGEDQVRVQETTAA